MRFWSACLLAALALMVLSPVFIWELPIGEVEGAGELRATIELDAYEPNVDVDPQRGGVTTYTGKVVTTQPRDFDFQFGILELEAICTNPEWKVTKIPQLTVTLSSKVVDFSVSVSVPQFTLATEGDTIHKIIISGTWRYEPGIYSGQIDPAEAFIHVNHIYQYSVRSDPGYVQTSPGGEFDIELVIENMGNGPDEVLIQIDRRSSMEDKGWAFVLPQTNFDLAHQAVLKIPITVSAPTRWDGWRNVISVVRFQITSSQALQNNDVAETVYYSLYVRQRGVSVPGFEAPLMVLAVMIVALLAVHRRK